LKIGLISDGPFTVTSYGKVGNYLSYLLATKYGHQIHYCSLQYGGTPIQLDWCTMYEGVESQGAGKGKALAKFIREVKPEILIHMRDNWILDGNFSNMAYDLYSWCVGAGVKLILYSPVQSDYLPMSLINVSNKCEHLITMTDYGKQRFLERGFTTDKIDFIYHGVNTETFHPRTEEEKSDCKLHFGFNRRKKLIGYIAANIDYRKNTPAALQILRQMIDKRGDNYQLILWTEPRAYYALGEWMDKLHLTEEQVRFSGMTKNWGSPEEEMSILYGAMDCYLNTSTSEGFGIPILEALASGVPVVSSDLPVLREIYGDAINYVFSSPDIYVPWGATEMNIDINDAVSTVNLALDLKDHPHLYKRIKKGVELAQQYTWERAAEQMEAIIQKVAKLETKHALTLSQGTDDWYLPALHEGQIIVRFEDVFKKIIEDKESPYQPEVFIDVGAHVGTWTLRLQKFFKRVIAYEPNPNAYNVLFQNIGLNQMKNVFAYKEAVSNVAGAAMLKVYDLPSHSSILDNPTVKTEATGVIPIVTSRLDDLNLEGMALDLLKVDVEGAELLVLEGASRLITENLPRLCIECHTAENVVKVEEFLTEIGYKGLTKIPITETLYNILSL